MKKGKLIGKIFAIAIAFLMIGAMLGGTLGSTGVASADEVSSVSLDVPYFSQRDDRWGSDPMVSDAYKMWRRGCAVTSTAMVLSYYGVHAVTWDFPYQLVVN